MGQLVDGTWTTDNTNIQDASGAFKRSAAQFRNWITPDGSAGISGSPGFPAASGRYHLYVSYACPWAHRTLIFRQLKGLQEHISVSVVYPVTGDDGWTFQTDDKGATGDTLLGLDYVRDLYIRSDPTVSTRETVPILWDSHQNQIVSNESSEIIRMFNSAFDHLTGDKADYWPVDLRDEIEKINDRIYQDVNNGVYRAGFASTQSSYDTAVADLFTAFDWLEQHLSEHRYLMGEQITEADWRLFTTLVRFDNVYHLHFKCNRRRLVEYPNLWGFTRELYQWPGVADTVNMGHINRHYYQSHESISPRKIIPINPIIDWSEPHGRDTF